MAFCRGGSGGMVRAGIGAGFTGRTGRRDCRCAGRSRVPAAGMRPRQRPGPHLGIPVGHDQPQRRGPQRFAQIGQQPQRSLIGTVQVINHHDLRGSRGRVPQRLPDPLEQLKPGSRPATCPSGDRLPAEPAQHLHPRPQRRRPFTLPARPPRHHRTACPPSGLPGQPGLADTRLPAQQHRTAGPRSRLRGQRIKNGKLGVPANQHARCRQPPHGDTVSPKPRNDRRGQTHPLPPANGCSARTGSQIPIVSVGIHSRRSAPTSADSGDPPGSPDVAKHRRAEAIAATQAGTRITGWLSVWPSKNEKR